MHETQNPLLLLPRRLRSGREPALRGYRGIVTVRLASQAAPPRLHEAMRRDSPDTAPRRYALVPVAQFPSHISARERIVCNCLEVSEDGIDAGQPRADVQRVLECGTQCGSCAPELRRLAAAPSFRKAG